VLVRPVTAGPICAEIVHEEPGPIFSKTGLKVRQKNPAGTANFLASEFPFPRWGGDYRAADSTRECSHLILEAPEIQVSCTPGFYPKIVYRTLWS
jgi:hypothetical protein